MEENTKNAIKRLANVVKAQHDYLVHLAQRVEQQGVIVNTLRSHATPDQNQHVDKMLREFAIHHLQPQSTSDGMSALFAELDRLLA